MMRKVTVLVLTLIFSLLVCVAPVVAQPPSIPANHIFYGEVNIDGNTAPDGTTVSAHIGSLSWSTITSDGKYGYGNLFFVPPDDPARSGKDGGENGDEIIFKVDGEAATTAAFQTYAVTELNLNVGTTDERYYILTVNVLPLNSGTVTLIPSKADNEYEQGTSVTLLAQPATGYEFDYWSGGSGGSANPVTISMDGDKSVTAHFNETSGEQYSLEISSKEGGSVLAPGEGTFHYEAEERVILVASPSNGYEFDKWTGDVDTVADVDDHSTFLTMDGDKSVTANFNEISVERYSLEISSSEGGAVTTPGEGTFRYDAAEKVKLVASPDEGYKFDGWTGDINTVAGIEDSATTITMNDDKSVNAVFTAVTPGISPAQFTFSNLLVVPGEINPDQQVEISIETANQGGTTGAHTIILYINGDMEDSITVSIAPGSKQDVFFMLNKTIPGIYEVVIEGLTGQFIVTAPSTTNTTHGFNTGIIVAVATFIAVLVPAVLFIRRRRI
jgi:hypothetical protein